MRVGVPDPFDPDGSERSEPGGLVLVAWSGLAAVALVFAAVAVLYRLPAPAPEIASVDPRPTGSVERPDLAPGAPGGAGVIALVGRGDFAMQSDDPATERPEFAQLKIENAALRQSDAALRGRIDELTARIEALEERLGDLTGSVPAETSGTAGAPAEPPPAAPLPDSPSVTHAAFAVELGSFSDLPSAEAAWRDMVRDEPALFADLQPVVTVRDRGGRTELLLVAGPFADAGEAAARCALAGEVDIECLPAFFVGQPLSLR